VIEVAVVVALALDDFGARAELYLRAGDFLERRDTDGTRIWNGDLTETAGSLRAGASSASRGQTLRIKGSDSLKRGRGE